MICVNANLSEKRPHLLSLIIFSVFTLLSTTAEDSIPTSVLFNDTWTHEEHLIHQEVILLDNSDELHLVQSNHHQTNSFVPSGSSSNTNGQSLVNTAVTIWRPEFYLQEELLAISSKQIQICSLVTPRRRCLNELFYLIDLKFGTSSRVYNESELENTCRFENIILLNSRY